MPRRRRMVQGVESSQELARKLEVLERELAVQRTAMEKLKLLGPPEKAAMLTGARGGPQDRVMDRLCGSGLPDRSRRASRATGDAAPRRSRLVHTVSSTRAESPSAEIDPAVRDTPRVRSRPAPESCA